MSIVLLGFILSCSSKNKSIFHIRVSFSNIISSFITNNNIITSKLLITSAVVLIVHILNKLVLPYPSPFRVVKFYFTRMLINLLHQT